MRTILLSFFSVAIILINSALAAVRIASASSDHGFTAHIIENALPTAAQTHEVLSIPGRNTLLVSQQSNSVLVKAQVNNGNVTGVAAFQIGSPTSQLHGLALSKRYPGNVWVTLQADNLVLLIDPRAHSLRSAPKVIKEIKVPEGKGPHYVGEYGDDLWISLQDSSAVLRINHVNTADYDHYQALPRPIFVAQHPINKNFYSSQDNSAKIIKIETATKLVSQIDIPATLGKTPVGLIAGPKGVWFALLGSATEGTGTVGFIGSDDVVVPFKLKSPLGQNASLLHLVFDLNADSTKSLWLLSSSIINSNALDMVIKVTFDDEWKNIVSEEVTVMPTQQNKAHRIIQTAADQLFATELATSKLLSFRTTQG
ncbi:hypothetical protein BGZ93_008115 [Podila epicladia]|nr:hypothetical protein BGZ92_004816 [Podila epicladia]KAG0092876.1 hypothetical protein BGZ93_008115 [Podila epicladia]